MASLWLLRLALMSILGLITKVHAENPEPIIGGHLVAAGELPYQVYIKVFDKFNCGGALITSQHVLTAAHCVSRVIEPTTDIVVVTGSVVLNEGDVHRVKSIYAHPQFVRSMNTSYAHDVAVIMLQKRINITDFQKPIRIATKQTLPDTRVVISGWGRTDTRNRVSQNLMKVEVTVIREDECQLEYPPIIYPSQLCTFDGKGIGFCMGDSGGPLVHNNEVIGIVSWSAGCASGLPDVYTKVYYYRSFIYETLHRSQME